MCEDFITSDDPKGYIERVGKDYIIITDIETDEQIQIEVGEDTAEYFDNECSGGETIFVLYDKKSKKLV
ncbi:MAG: hypothetical protein E6342_17650 [Clostridium sp.]|uniref:hypothetical protein n=1 Tax=Clostridium sp. TaxID=1506 RepID=UPI002915960F|nr:hypothetical protein [Clostridium sp.]MDU4843980.1 hypothetical protein [Leclercia adecarboxylata]MDU7089514.1 hypothetical protein [Clostridium sp.]